MFNKQRGKSEPEASASESEARERRGILAEAEVKAAAALHDLTETRRQLSEVLREATTLRVALSKDLDAEEMATTKTALAGLEGQAQNLLHQEQKAKGKAELLSKRVRELRQQRDHLQGERDRLAAVLDGVPLETRENLRQAVELIGEALRLIPAERELLVAREKLARYEKTARSLADVEAELDRLTGR